MKNIITFKMIQKIIDSVCLTSKDFYPGVFVITSATEKHFEKPLSSNLSKRGRDVYTIYSLIRT